MKKEKYFVAISMIILSLGPLLVCLNVSPFQAQFVLFALVNLVLFIFFSHKVLKIRHTIKWILLLIAGIFIVAYFFKFFVIVVDSAWETHGLHKMRPSSTDLYLTYQTISYGFITFVLTSLLLKAVFFPSDRITQLPEIKKISFRRKELIHTMFISLFMCMLFSYPLMYHFGIGVMGTGGAQLPTGIAGIIYYCHKVFIPVINLTIIYLTDRFRQRMGFNVGVLLLVINALISTILTTSRGVLMFYMIYLFFLLIITGGLNKNRRNIILAAVIVTIILWKPITQLRGIITSGAGSVSLSTTADVVDSTMSGNEIYDNTFAGAEKLFDRLNGANCLVTVIAHNVVLGLDKSIMLIVEIPGGVSRYYTTSVLGWSYEAYNLDSASLLGYFYLIGDDTAVIIGLFVTLLIIFGFIKGLESRNFAMKPVIYAVVLTFILDFFTGGALEAQGKKIITLVLSTLFCEMIITFGVKNRSYLKSLRSF